MDESLNLKKQKLTGISVESVVINIKDHYSPLSVCHIYLLYVGASIGKLAGSDCDTVPPYNQLQYFICDNSTALATEYFEIRANGEVFVRKSLTADSRNTATYRVSISNYTI